MGPLSSNAAVEACGLQPRKSLLSEMENLHVSMKTWHSQYKKIINKIPRFLGVPLQKVVRETSGRAGGEVPWGPRALSRPTLGHTDAVTCFMLV